MRTIYDWPIILRGELVYFGRAVALIEGIGARYVPGFNPVGFAAPVILKHRRAVLAAMGDDVSSKAALGTILNKLAGEVANVLVSATREIVTIVASQLPSLLKPIGSFLDALFEPPSAPRIKLLPPAVEKSVELVPIDATA
jgi:hypothetical protein